MIHGSSRLLLQFIAASFGVRGGTAIVFYGLEPLKKKIQVPVQLYETFIISVFSI